MKDLVLEIEQTYAFKDPWRATNRSLTIVVPIVAKAHNGNRSYVVLEETDAKILDVGRIDKARIEGYSEKPIFIRGGTILKGSTQERATQFSIVITPQKSMEIPVHCIHASRGIIRNMSMEASGVTPNRVYSSILSERNQARTWSEIRDYSARAIEETRMDGFHMASHRLARLPRDDLTSTFNTVLKLREDLKDILKQIPDHVNQVGTVIVDTEGVLGFEMYDHPDSWKAFSQSIIRSFADALTKQDKAGIFKPEMSAVIPLIRKFLDKISKAENETVFEESGAKTVIFRTEEYVGEYTSLGGKTIHVSASRLNPRQRLRKAQARRHVPVSSVSEQSTFGRLLSWGKRKTKKALQVLRLVGDEPKTWTAIESQASMSKATLASRLRELHDVGAIDKRRYSNGVARYSLTGIGQQILLTKNRPSSSNFGPQLQVAYQSNYEPRCPICGSTEVSVWGFTKEKTDLQCNICRHKWLEARK